MKKIIAFFIVFWVLMVLMLISSCSTAKKCERHIAKAKELGCLKESDSTKVVVKYIKGDTLISYVDVYVDSSEFDSLSKKDSCFTKDRIQTIIQKLKVTPVNEVDSNYNLQIWLENGKIRYELKLPSRRDSIVYQTKYLEHKPLPFKSSLRNIPKWLVMIVGILAILFSLIALKRK
jgi:hypothetical protein